MSQTTPAKRRVSGLPHQCDYSSWSSHFLVNHLTSQLAVTLGPKFITYVILLVMNLFPQAFLNSVVQCECHLPRVRHVFQAPPNRCSGLISRSVFPSKMTAFGFKHAGGAEGIAKGHPWGTCPHLTQGVLTPACRQGRRANRHRWRG